MSDEGFERWAQRRLESAQCAAAANLEPAKYRPGIPSRADRGRVPGDFLAMPDAAVRMGTSRKWCPNRPESPRIRPYPPSRRRLRRERQEAQPCEETGGATVRSTPPYTQEVTGSILYRPSEPTELRGNPHGSVGQLRHGDVADARAVHTPVHTSPISERALPSMCSPRTQPVRSSSTSGSVVVST